jgi:hypothetical protein
LIFSTELGTVYEGDNMAELLKETIGKVLDLFDRGAKGCVDTLSPEEIERALGESERLLASARVASIFKEGSEASDALATTLDALQKFRATLSTMKKSCEGWHSIRAIFRAIDTLRRVDHEKDRNLMAASIGDLVSNLGKLAQHLPAPAPSYGKIVEKFDRDFFMRLKGQLSWDEKNKHYIANKLAAQRQGVFLDR